MFQTLFRLDGSLPLGCASLKRKNGNLIGCIFKTQLRIKSGLECISKRRNMPTLKDTACKNHMIWLTAYDESGATRDIKRGHVSPSRNTCKFQTVFNSHF